MNIENSNFKCKLPWLLKWGRICIIQIKLDTFLKQYLYWNSMRLVKPTGNGSLKNTVAVLKNKTSWMKCCWSSQNQAFSTAKDVGSKKSRTTRLIKNSVIKNLLGLLSGIPALGNNFSVKITNPVRLPESDVPS